MERQKAFLAKKPWEKTRSLFHTVKKPWEKQRYCAEAFFLSEKALEENAAHRIAVFKH